MLRRRGDFDSAAGRAARSPDAGVTLAELIVAMGLSSIVGALTLSMFLGVNKATSVTTDHDQNAADARNTLQLWSQYLAVADSPVAAGSSAHRFEWITPEEVLFYANLDNRAGATSTPPTLVWLARRGGNLVTETFRPSSAAYPGVYPRTPTNCTVAARGVRDGAIFTGLSVTEANPSGAILGTLGLSLATTTPAPGPADSPCWPLPSASGNAAVSQQGATANTNLSEVNTVALDFTVADGHDQHPQTFTTTVGLGGGQ